MNIDSGTVGLPEAAEILKVSINTVTALIDTGELPAAKVGRAWVMLRRDVMHYLEKEVAAQTARRLGMTSPQNSPRKRKGMQARLLRLA